MSAATNSGKRCAAMLCGRRVLVEYQTGRDDDGPYVNVLAVHAGDWRITADRFSEDQIADLERECEAAEITAEECAFGIPTEGSTAPMNLRRAVLGPVAAAERRAA